MKLPATISLFCFSIVALAQESVGSERVHPLSLGDDDPGNHVIACLGETSPAVSVSAIAGFFHGLGDDTNPATSIDVVSKIIE